MKREVFILLFIIFASVIFYVPQPVQSAEGDCSSYAAASCPSPQCKLQTKSSSGISCQRGGKAKQICVVNPDSENSDCFQSGSGVLSSSNPSTPAGFVYENTKTDNWEFELIGDNVRISYPTLSLSTNPGSGAINAEMEASEGDCAYYSFSYQRPAQTVTYQLPAQSSTPQNVNGQSLCVYSLTPVTSGSNRISLLAGKPLQSLDQVCPTLQRGKPITPTGPPVEPQASPELSPPNCPSSEECKVATPIGPLQYFGFTAKKDACGKTQLTPDNNGAPISQAQLADKKNAAMANCAQKEETPQSLPAYCKKSSPPEIIYCKECTEYKNKFGKDSNDGFACSKLSGGVSTSQNDGKDCKLWQSGGASPGKWDDDTYNSAWGVCKNGMCVHSNSALPSGKSCSCNCNGKQMGWNEYCKSGDFVCAKKPGKISGLSNNICQSWKELVCANNQGAMRDSDYARKQCESQGNLFYSKVTTKSVLGVPTGIKKVECFCVNKPKECK